MDKRISWIGWVFVIFGCILVVGTVGRSDYQDLTPGVSPGEIVPFWRLCLQIVGGLALIFLGRRLA